MTSRYYHRLIRRILMASIATVLFWPAGAASAADTLSEQAVKVYREALSQMHVKQYQQAADLFSQMIKRYGTNENVPDAQLYLAVCLRGQELDDDYIKQLDLCERIYAGTEVELLAINGKLSYYAAKKDADNYIATLKELCGPTGHKAVDEYMLDPGEFHYRGTNMAGPRRYFATSFRDHLDDLCKKPEVAQQVLDLMAGTFKKGPGYLPQEWFWTHVHLLYRAGKAEEAKKQFDAYDAYWGTDVRNAKLWFAYGEYLRTETKDLPAARKIYEEVMKKWEGTLDDGAGEAGYQLARMLETEKDPQPFIDMATPFTKRYKTTNWGNGVRAMLHKKAMELAPSDKKMADLAFAMFEEDMLDLLPQEQAASIEKQIDLAVTLKMEDKAKALFTQMLDPKVWGGWTYGRALALAKRHTMLQPQLDALRTKYLIKDPVADSEPAKLLAQLKMRMADDQMRFAEEIAEELFTKHTEAAETMDALKLMVDYYFKQVMPEPRDKWMGRMISTYEYHPDTEQVINQRCVASQAAAEYDQVAQDTELAIQRFPASQYRGNWVSYRIKAYEAAKDMQGKYKLMEKEYGPRIRSGNIYSLQLLINAIPIAEGEDAGAKRAAAWMGWADKFGEVHPALSCLAQARSAFESLKVWDKAHIASNRLRTQKIDPAVAQAYEFDDIDLYIAAQDHEKVVAAAARLPQQPKPRFRSGRRFSLGSVGTSFGKLKRIGPGKSLAARLQKLYDAPEDINGVDYFMASMFVAANDTYGPTPEAGKHYLNIVERTMPPDIAYRVFTSALYHHPENLDPVRMIDDYLKLIPRAHHLRPDLIKRQGEYYIAQKSNKALATQGALTRGYPASKARDEFDDRIERIRKASRGKR